MWSAGVGVGTVRWARGCGGVYTAWVELMLQILTYAVFGSAVVTGLGAVVDFVRNSRPDWVALIGAAVTEVLVVIAVVVAMVLFFTGQSNATAVMAWGYSLCAVALLPVAFVWAVGEPTRWANLVLIVAVSGVAGLVGRIQELW